MACAVHVSIGSSNGERGRHPVGLSIERPKTGIPIIYHCGVSDGNPAPSTPSGDQPVHWRAWLEVVITAALGCIVFVIGFGSDLRRLTRPLAAGDMLQPYVNAQLWGSGSPFGNNSFGYPFGIDLRYFPTTDIAQNTVAGIITALSKNPFLGINMVYALSFPLVAVAALWVFKLVGVRGPISILSSLAFTAIPFHWLRIEHLYLGTMYSAVVGVGLAILTGSGEVSRRMADRRRLRTIVLVCGLALVVATGGIYYACFSILLCGAALVYRLAHERSWRSLLSSTVPAAAIISWTAVALAPAFLFVRAHPPIQPVADRLPIESVAYSGNLALLLTPAPYTHLPLLSKLNPRIENAFSIVSGSGQSGVAWLSNSGSYFTVAALALACIGVIVSIRRRGDYRSGATLPEGADQPHPVTFGLVGTLLATAVLFFVPWGLNVVFAALVTPQIRGWDRLTPVILLLFFVGAVLALKTLRLRQYSWISVVASVALLVLLIPDTVAPYAATFATNSTNGAANYTFGANYARDLNSAIPGDCAILQLPYSPYPEYPTVYQLGAYEQFWPALTNPEKRWTYGATKGTVESNWMQILGDNLDQPSLEKLAAAGFCGVHLDKRGYTPEAASAVVARLDDLLGAPVASGHGGDWTAWPLPGRHAAALAPSEVSDLPTAVAALFYPPEIAPAPGNPLPAESDGLSSWWWTTSPAAEFDVTSSPKFMFRRIVGSVRAAPCGARDATVELRSGSDVESETLQLSGATGPQPFSLELPANVSSAQLTVRTSGPACQIASDTRTLFLALENARAE